MAKPYCLDTFNGFMLARCTEGSSNYSEVGFRVNGVLPEDEWQIELAKDGISVIWKPVIYKLCFAKQHVRALMGNDYSETHNNVVVVAYDNTVQIMDANYVKPRNDFYWGTDQVVPLHDKCTGTHQLAVFIYKTELNCGEAPPV